MRLSLFLALFQPALVFSQSVELTIKDMETKKVIPAATIAYKKKPIAKADMQGKANVSLDYKMVWVYAMGFDTAEVVLGSTQQIVYLYKKDNKLKEVTIKPWIDEYANSLIKKMMDKAKENHPDRLASYQFYTYSKFTADAEADTSKLKLEAKDTAEYKEGKDFLKNNKIFVWERASIFKHDKNLGTKKILLNSNMSGFKMPIYELLAISLDEVNFLPRIFRGDAYKEYYFRIEDSFQLNGRKTYEVAFFPFKKTKNKRSRHGYVHIDALTYGCMAYKGTTKQGFFELHNQLIENKVFTKTLFVNLTNSMVQLNNFNTNTIYKLKVENVEVPKVYTKSDFKGYDAEISSSLNDKSSEDLLVKLRGADTLLEREKNTYTALDSIVKKQNLESKLRLFLALRNGYVRLGKISLSIVDLLQFNRYEGFRLTLAGETNYKFHPKLSFNGLLGYGFGDQVFKYKLGSSFMVNYQNQSIISLQYENEVYPAGRAFSNLGSKMEKFNHLMNVWFFDKYYQSQSLSLGYQSDLHKYLEQKSTIQYERVSANFPYTFLGQTIDGLEFVNFNLDLKYYPKTKYLVTPEGKHKISSKPTVIALNYAYRHPVNTVLNPYHTLSIEGKSSFKSPLGKTEFSTCLGYMHGSGSLISLFEGFGSSNRNTDLIPTFGLGSYRFFETMEPSSFYSDQYVSLFVKHHLPSIPLNYRYELRLSLIYKTLLGSLRDPSKHSLPLAAPDELYQEGGIEWDDIINKFPIGLGFYYRFGAYYQGEFKDNFAARLLLRL